MLVAGVWTEEKGKRKYAICLFVNISVVERLITFHLLPSYKTQNVQPEKEQAAYCIRLLTIYTYVACGVTEGKCRYLSTSRCIYPFQIEYTCFKKNTPACAYNKATATLGLQYMNI
jgi:hypothetical protein